MTSDPGAGDPAPLWAVLMGVAYIRLIRYGVKWRVLSPERAGRLTAAYWAAGPPPGKP